MARAQDQPCRGGRHSPSRPQRRLSPAIIPSGASLLRKQKGPAYAGPFAFGWEYRSRGSGHLAAGNDGELAALVPRRLALCLRRLFVLAPEIERAGVEQAFEPAIADRRLERVAVVALAGPIVPVLVAQAAQPRDHSIDRLWREQADFLDLHHHPSAVIVVFQLVHTDPSMRPGWPRRRGA